jgi:hypothetical protein
LLFGSVVFGQQAQIPTSGYIPPLIQQGTPAGSYALSQLFTLNYFTGRLQLAVPLTTVHGRGEASFPVSYVFDSSVVIQHTYGQSQFCPSQGQPCDVYTTAAQQPLSNGLFSFGGIHIMAGLVDVKHADSLLGIRSPTAIP